MSPRDRDSFSELVGPQAIESHLAAARKDAKRVARLIARLEDLLATRKAEIAAGTWPPGNNAAAGDDPLIDPDCR